MRMADISDKPVLRRVAEASGRIRLRRETVELIRRGGVEKGDPLGGAQFAGVEAAKKTWELLPLCHQIPLTSVDVSFELGADFVEVRTRVAADYKTGVEMEALTSCALALLTIWDMVKKYEKDEKGQYPYTLIEGIRVVSKVKGEQ
ncbi:cyclic pyranopterin monophosphate synthase MoaC [Candidatus Marsarchaeota G2 archaeon OSP_D]|jgi:molybdenum cofactor biosynthesis protein MoaC|uniref:Cyclic pyranopterin monophosphate synthase MoaC n=4 Tax=Candidatus Marsarchaeota group 2 TaxID=2203771 RepID=A0A2R6C3V7_9ARCH|nr:MAG: cyclic pyranopterin monophosphate synthase MoaC [Candidatus Marsarchaeota G2 archaeon OSP_D]PSN97873.1 MAG: cyclic pyranopterin monophosphate synthase MoaC [Candidatus Marsarchaeota G2 archaeon ECH_B_3]PSN99317.1 MAG: cyclic pyranopterin monophosphate synthase MoaC [Candidatus Marsarchaeota G2 archaeon ECH_B_1]PSO05524.1 MAG: cyclic pyranopterin monophosphate synthase MoaC [Candidatus Marsarchaeota G2 archaeon BE_D]